MRVLVTGGAGFIGSHLIRRIVNQPEVELLVNLDALTYAANLANLQGIHQEHPRYVFEHGDIRDSEFVQRVIVAHDISHVFHLAAESHVDRSIQSAGIFVESNVNGTLNLLNACRSHWRDVDQKLFLQVSTDEVYGSLRPEEAPFTEESPLLPNSPYAASKAAADCLVRSYVKTYGFPAVITRCCNNYGLNQHAEKLIPTVLKCLHERRSIPIYGDGLNVREWLRVTDHIEALWQVLLHGREGEVYNIGSGHECTNRELVEMLCDLWDEQAGLPQGTSRALMKQVPDRAGHDRRYAMNAGKLRSCFPGLPKPVGFQGMEALVKAG